MHAERGCLEMHPLIVTLFHDPRTMTWHGGLLLPAWPAFDNPLSTGKFSYSLVCQLNPASYRFVRYIGTNDAA